MSGCTLYYNDNLCHLTVGISTKITTAGSYYNAVSGTIPSAYRPTQTITVFNDGTSNVRWRVNSSGNLMIYGEKTTTSNATYRASFTWARI